MSKVVFVVSGTTGEYSDREEWAVCAYEDEALAKEHVLKAQQRGRELFDAGQYSYSPDEPTSIYDPFIRISYTGVSYRYDPVQVRDALPTQD